MFKKKIKELPSTYCPLAWTHSFVNQDGSYQVCCTSEEFDNYIKDDQGKKMFIQQGHSPEDVMNSLYMKQLRLDMVNGKWPDLCQRCEMGEKLNGISRRNLEIKNFESQNNHFLSKMKKDGTISNSIHSADYRLGNLCNLQCRMCNPRSTQLWIKEWNEIKPERERFNQEIMDSYKKYDWINSPSLIEDFTKKATNLTHIHFAGGEPLIAPQMEKILDACIESENAKNITITYNTNMTVLPPKILEKWKSFKAIKILASIDAIDELNNYIRYPANWEKIHANLTFIDKNHETYNIQECMLSTTVQVLNVLRMEELYKYLEQFQFIVKAPNLINLNVPEYFQTTILPPKLKALAGLKLRQIQEKYSERLPAHYQYLTQNIDQVLGFMNSASDYENGLFKEFKEFQKKFDEKRKLNLYQYNPEFSKF